MCLGIPLKIVSINGKDAVGELNGIKRKVRVDLIPNLEIDDYVMVHAGFAIEKLDEEGARKALEIINVLEEVLGQD